MNIEIFNFFHDLVCNFGSILRIIPFNVRALDILSQYFPFSFEANIIIKDSKDKLFFRVSPEGSCLIPNRNRYATMTIISNESTMLEIIRGRASLLREFNFGTVSISNLKQNYMYRIILLGMILNSKKKYDERGKILAKLPISPVRAFLALLLNERFSGLFAFSINKILKKLILKLILKP